MKLFKVACLSYKASDLVYREHTMTRGALISMRRDLIDKITQNMIATKLFKDNLAYPRRFFDDLMLEQRKAQKHTHSQYDNTIRGLTGSQAKLKELLA